MSDGDGKDSVKSERERDYQKSNKKKSRVDDFPQAIARIAMAQVCEGLGFQSFQQSALDTLTDVAVRYIREIGRVSSSCANLANRSECNVFDMIQGLEDLGSVQGFSGALDVGRSLSGSGVVSDIMRYVGESEEIPFAYSVPGFPVVQERRLNPSFVQADKNLPDEHIPSWLPKFPDPETHAELNMENNKDALADEKSQRAESQHTQLERPSLNLHESMICNGSEVGVASEQRGATNSHRAAEINPYLAPPLHFGDREVHLPILPAKFLEESTSTSQLQSHEVKENHVSALEPLLPEDEPYDRRKILLNGRPSVHFKLENCKKSSGMRRSTQNEGVEEISIWFTEDHGGKDEIYRKAEQIFR